MRIELSQTIAAPVDRVFALLSEPSERARWQASLWRVDVLTEGETRVGTRWAERPLGLARVELEIVELERDRLWSERAEMPIGAFMLRLRFAPEGETKTRLHVEAELTLRGIAKLLGPGARFVLPRAFASDLRRAERILREE